MGFLSRAFVSRAAVAFLAVLPLPACAAFVIPATRATALDGHTVEFPHDLGSGSTVLILGFSRHSSDATTAWEIPTRTQLAASGAAGFYDMAMLAEVPGFARGFALYSIRKAVPDILKPNFLPLLNHEAEWKQIAGFDPKAADAAYVLLVDRSGIVRWSTHQPFTAALFARLREAAQALSAQQ